jgi:hypothetical protein
MNRKYFLPVTLTKFYFFISLEKVDKDDKKKRAASTVPDGSQDLKLAEDVCKSALSLTIPAPAHKRALLATLTRIQVTFLLVVYFLFPFIFSFQHSSICVWSCVCFR